MAPIAVGFVIVNIVIRRLYPLMRQNQEELARISEHVLESFQGVATIQGFVAEEASLSLEASFALLSVAEEASWSTLTSA